VTFAFVIGGMTMAIGGIIEILLGVEGRRTCRSTRQPLRRSRPGAMGRSAYL